MHIYAKYPKELKGIIHVPVSNDKMNTYKFLRFSLLFFGCFFFPEKSKFQL